MLLEKLRRLKAFGRSTVINSTTKIICSARRFACGASLREVDREGITIGWNDKEEDYYHSIWLRHNCHCPLCRADYCNQKIVEPSDLVNSRITKATINDGDLKLTWQVDNGSHEGFIPLQWLKQNNYSEEKLAKRRECADPGVAPKGYLPEIDYETVMESDHGVWKWLWNLNEYGLCIVNNVPTVAGTVQQAGERIAHIQETIYGKLFDVMTTEKPINIAYSGAKLSFHMDLVYYESPPGLQLLHCLRNDDIVGGESLLLDAYPVLEDMRTQHPKEFDTLTKIPATFQKIHYQRESPIYIVSQVPHVVLDDSNKIIAINWSPAFEGPLSIFPANVECYYQAYVLLDRLLNSSDRLLQFHLLPGQLISFNNRRILHGRNSFTSNGGVRHLQGVYINIDEFNSRFHVLNGTFGTEQAKRVFNHSTL